VRRARKKINQYTRYGNRRPGPRFRRWGIAFGLEHWGHVVLPEFRRIFLPRLDPSSPWNLRHHAVDCGSAMQITSRRRRQWHFADHLRRHRGAPFPSIIGPEPGIGAPPARSIPLLLVGFAVFAGGAGRVPSSFMERAQRRLFVTYPKRQVGNKVYGGDSSHLPLKTSTFPASSPPIFASSILLIADHDRQLSMPRTCPIGCRTLVTYLSRGQPLYLVLYAALILFFFVLFTPRWCFKPGETADNLKKYGRRLPGYSPRQEERPIYRLCPHPYHRDRRALI